ncbi:hypothetical protein [Paraflavitalea sp. CAU 1676]|uniref:hypothetical protein n=1 Tax=Paraflavitalea sp. CAU 1676 TaxID=3032598 RepID=UPI0023DA5D4C|nr:hypothetical protein [Paraflavitalea sp. CAU 1676]MDF2193515.1 hypothetical protein [Paraflavitalea sp. CAU 1676]
MITRYGRKRLMKRLVRLLSDTTRDWYANILLYSFPTATGCSFTAIRNRREWIKWSKEEDVKYWRDQLRNDKAPSKENPNL